MYCYAEEVPTTGQYLFDDAVYAQATLHVPASSLDLYKEDLISGVPTFTFNQLYKFRNIVPLTESDPTPTSVKTMKRNELKSNTIYNINGQPVSQPRKGLYIINGRQVVVK